MRERLGFFLLCLAPFINWVVAGCAVGKYCELHFGWHYAIGILIWAGVNIALTIPGIITLARQS